MQTRAENISLSLVVGSLLFCYAIERRFRGQTYTFQNRRKDLLRYENISAVRRFFSFAVVRQINFLFFFYEQKALLQSTEE